MLSGVRQGGVLSPVLFAIFIDILVLKINVSNIGCYMSSVCVSIFLYADDILLLAPFITGLQQLVNICDSEIISLDMQINTKNPFVYVLEMIMMPNVKTLYPCKVAS